MFDGRGEEPAQVEEPFALSVNHCLEGNSHNLQ
jgi:hypothetical protein